MMDTLVNHIIYLIILTAVSNMKSYIVIVDGKG